MSAPSPAMEADAAPARVLFLGTHHFANPGLDVVKAEVDDVLAPHRQAEIEAVVERLAGFRPTRIAVEARADAARRLDQAYAAYRSGTRDLARDEHEQMGFRLAARLQHPRVHPIDHAGEFPFEAMMAYAMEHDPAFVDFVRRTAAEMGEEEERMHREMSIGGQLRARNDPEWIAREHGLYTRFARVGAGDTYVGANLLAAWYARNIRIFANLRRVAEPGERVLVIFGSGHAAILRELIAHAPDMVLIDARDHLPG